MENRQTRRGFAWKRLTGYLLLTIGVGLIAYIAVANVVYYGSLPADLPCRGCEGEARSVSVGGFNLYYREVGSDRGRAPVVVLHGGPGHSSLSFKRSLDFLADQRRVIYYDQRGSGNSQIVPDNSAYSIDQLVEELEVLRRDVVGVERMVVVGHSAGGVLAQRYALKYAAHVERLVLVSSVQINNAVGLPAVWDRLFPALFVLGGFPPADPQARDQWFSQLNEATSVPRLYDPSTAGLLHETGYLSFATWREVSRSVEGDDFKDQLRRLPVPSLVVYGTADSTYSGEATASGLCALLPACTLARMERSGHWPFLEEPVAFAQAVRIFLGD